MAIDGVVGAAWFGIVTWAPVHERAGVTQALNVLPEANTLTTGRGATSERGQ